MTDVEKKAQIKKLCQELLESSSCCKELKDATRSYLESVDTDAQKERAAALIAELKEDVTPIDGFIAFLQTEHAAKLFGEDLAKAELNKALEAKKNGETICTCSACQIGKQLLALEADL